MQVAILNAFLRQHGAGLAPVGLEVEVPAAALVEVEVPAVVLAEIPAVVLVEVKVLAVVPAEVPTEVEVPAAPAATDKPVIAFACFFVSRRVRASASRGSSYVVYAMHVICSKQRSTSVRVAVASSRSLKVWSVCMRSLARVCQ